jgi:hypothetical protein
MDILALAMALILGLGTWGLYCIAVNLKEAA